MAGVLRRLVTEVVLRSTEAVKGLKAYDALWKVTAKSVESSATMVERAAERAGAAMARMSSGAAAVRQGVGGMRPAGGGGGGGGPRLARDPLDAAIARANREERQRAQAQARADKQAQAIAKTQTREGQSGARSAGLAAGSAGISSATAALGTFASATDKAKAKVSDLNAQVVRNRKELADLKRQALETGDADGKLKARMEGLSVATGQANVALQKARGELRRLEGGFFAAVKKAASMETRVVALGTALGNLGYDVARGALTGIAGGFASAAKEAIDFESSMADVKKVLSAPDLKNFDVLNQGVLDLSKSIGIAPTEVAALTAALAQSGIAGQELLATAEDASKLAVAFGMSGQDAGQALAKLRTGMGLTREQVNSLAGTINELSNNLAATAPEITDAVQRVGSVAKAANISAESTAALATSMIASGANAEVAATGTKNFIRALGSGAAATKKQREAFAALGLQAEEVAGYLVKGGAESEKAIKGVVERIGQLRAEDRLPVLIELFGSESIGAIGPLATNIDLLTRSFNLAGDAAAAAGSVEKEFAARSATTDQAIKKLKASVSVLAIEFGNQLLPYINDIVKFLTSPEGQEWGRGAVEKAKDAAVGFAEAVKTVAGALGFLIDNLGGVGTAVSLLGVAIASLAGPWGIAAAAATAALAGMVMGMGKVLGMIPQVRSAIDSIISPVAEAIGQDFAARNRAADDAALDSGSVHDGPTYGYAAPAAPASAANEGGVVGLAEARAAKAAEKAAARAAKKHGRGHKATKMDQRLAALSPDLAGVLTRGGELDRGGDAKVAGNVLDKAVFARASGGGEGGGGSLGPGPNITTNIYNTNVNVAQAIDARSTAPVPENIRGAAQQMGKMGADAMITGHHKIIAARNAGGRMA